MKEVEKKTERVFLRGDHLRDALRDERSVILKDEEKNTSYYKSIIMTKVTKWSSTVALY